MVGKEVVNHLSWSTWGDAWFLVPGHELAVLNKGLVLLVMGITLGCVLLMLEFEPEEEQLSWLRSTSRNKEPLKCIWVSRAGHTQRRQVSAARRGPLVTVIFLTEAALLLPLLQGAAGKG